MSESFETQLSSLLQTLEKGENKTQTLAMIQVCLQKLEELRKTLLLQSYSSSYTKQKENQDEINIPINLHWGC